MVVLRRRSDLLPKEPQDVGNKGWDKSNRRERLSSPCETLSDINRKGINLESRRITLRSDGEACHRGSNSNRRILEQKPISGPPKRPAGGGQGERLS
jgi:hypothetical protein